MNPMSSDPPLLSVILVTPDVYATVRTTVSHLARQSVSDRQAPVIAFAEDHAFPDPLWAEALLRAAARLAHMNYAMPAVWMRAQFHNGRLFAAQRLRGASRWKRLVFVAASPMIPFVRLVRTLREATRLGRWGLLVRVTPVLFLGLLVDGLGQLVGYAAGVGSAMRHLVDIEFHRVRYARLAR